MEEEGEEGSWSGTPGVISSNKPPPSFPCLEQPTRVVLSWGYPSEGKFLWSTKGGVVSISGKHRRWQDREEFVLVPVPEVGQDIVLIQNAKFQRYLAVVDAQQELETRAVDNDIQVDDNSETVDSTNTSSRNQNVATSIATVTDMVQPEMAQWCLQRDLDTGRVIITSVYNGAMLCATSERNVLQIALNSPTESNHSSSFRSSTGNDIMAGWNIDSVTGELCFLHHASWDRRIRCDLVGVLSLTENWKGWEAWRLLDAPVRGVRHSGYVRICSWMHRQFYLCCNAAGKVQACTWAKAMVEGSGWDTEWAISKNENENSGHEGVVLESRLYGRLLSIASDEHLCTVSANNLVPDGSDLVLSDDRVEPRQEEKGAEIVTGIEENKDTPNDKDHAVPEHAATTTVAQEDQNEKDGLLKGPSPTIGSASSIVWQLEAAHRQRYSLTSTFLSQASPDDEKASGGDAVSLGPFPYVSKNLKQSDEWTVQHREPGVVALQSVLTPDGIKKGHTTEQFLCATYQGSVELRDEPDDGAELWNMKAEEGGYSFQSRLFSTGFLTFEAGGNESSGTLVCVSRDDEPSSRTQIESTEEGETPASKTHTFVWGLNPCMPRAVSSSKIKTFAIGTSIAIGTTVAMPFAMAGAVALLGAVGAEVGLLANIVTVGLTGAEAIASVGVVGATAAIVFREESETLAIDDQQKKSGDDDDEDEETQKLNSFSKRPFCAWRSW